MHFINKVISRFMPPPVDDAFFGGIGYQKVSGGRPGYWEAVRLFSPSGKDVEIFIDSPAREMPPTDMQREFYQWVEDSYAVMMGKIEPLLREKNQEYAKDGLAKPFDGEFTLTSFDIPLQETDAPEWSMCFNGASDDHFHCLVTMRGGDVENVIIRN